MPVPYLRDPYFVITLPADVLTLNSSPPGQNGRHFADDIFKRVFLNEKVRILIRISLKFVTKVPNDNNQALV